MRAASFLLLLAALLVPSAASALTVQDVIKLSNAGVSDDVLIAMIDRDRPAFPLEPDQVVALKRAGVSEAVVLAMIKGGREQATTEAWLPPPPLLVVVGHGPDRPNTTHQFDGPLVPVVPFGATYFVVAPALPAPCVVSGGQRPASAAPPRAPFLNDLGTRYLGSGIGRLTRNGVTPPPATAPAPPAFLTDCDGVMIQPPSGVSTSRAIRTRPRR